MLVEGINLPHPSSNFFLLFKNINQQRARHTSESRLNDHLEREKEIRSNYNIHKSEPRC